MSKVTNVTEYPDEGFAIITDENGIFVYTHEGEIKEVDEWRSAKANQRIEENDRRLMLT